MPLNVCIVLSNESACPGISFWVASDNHGPMGHQVCRHTCRLALEHTPCNTEAGTKIKYQAQEDALLVPLQLKPNAALPIFTHFSSSITPSLLCTPPTFLLKHCHTRQLMIYFHKFYPSHWYLYDAGSCTRAYFA
jgi:hypothetical protein